MVSASDYKKLLHKSFTYLLAKIKKSQPDSEFCQQGSVLLEILSKKTFNDWSIKFSLPIMLRYNDSQINGSGSSKQKKLLKKNEAELFIGGEVYAIRGNIIRQTVQVCIIYGAVSADDNGAVVHSSNNDFSQCNVGSCCRISNKKRIVRKFHFDFDDNHQDVALDIKSHLQYGGVYPDNANIHYCLDHDLEWPRVPFIPCSLLTIIDIILRGFEFMENIYNDQDWRTMVKDSETIFTQPLLKNLNMAMVNGKYMHDKYAK